MQIKSLAFLTIILTYALIVFGGYVASSESGMGCGPEWPLCNGSVIPVLQGETLIEFTHRVIGAILGVLTLVLVIRLLRHSKNGQVRTAAWGILFLLIIQILLGAVVVILDLPAIVVTSHLLIAMIFLASLIWVLHHAGRIETGGYAPVSKGKKQQGVIHFNILLIMVLFTLAIGAYIKHETYGLACSWLDCGTAFFPASFPEILQTMHRILAAATTLYILLLTYWAVAKGWHTSLQNRLMTASLIILLQLIAGVLTIVSFLDIFWAVLHLAIGSALFAAAFEIRLCAGMHAKTKQTSVLISKEGKKLI